MPPDMSLPGLTRQPRGKFTGAWPLDARVKPGHDSKYFLALG